MEEKGLGLVAMGGTGNVPSALSVLNAMKVPTKAIVDLDFVFGPALQQRLIEDTDAAVLGCAEIFARLKEQKKIHIGTNGFPERSPSGTAAQAYEILATEADAIDHIEAIHQHFLNIGIWVWKVGSIETCLGLVSKKSSAHLSFLENYKNEEFRSKLPNYAEVQSLLNWLHLELVD